MATLTNKTIASTYTSLLKLEGDTGTPVAGASGDAVQVKTGDNDPTALYLNTDRVGIGTAGPDGVLDISSTNAELYIKEWSSSQTAPAQIRLQKNKGTAVDGSDASVADDTELGKISFWGWNDNSSAVQDEGASIMARVNGTPVNDVNDMPTELVFSTSANASATPTQRMTILADGSIVIGHTSTVATDEAKAFEILGTTGKTGAMKVGRWTASDDPPYLQFVKGNHGTIGNATIVDDNDKLGVIRWYGADGNDHASYGAEIFARINGTPGEDDLPTQLVFSTTADGDASSTERMTIDQAGNVGIGVDAPGVKLQIEETTAADCIVRIVAGEGNNSTLEMWADNGDDAADGIRMTGDTGGNWQISTSKTAGMAGSYAWDTRLTCTKDGNVGIGEADPNAILHVTRAANTNADALNEVDDESVVKIQYRADAEAAMYFGSLGSTKGYIQGTDDDGSHAYDISINPYGGNVGIGTDSPGGLLSVGSANEFYISSSHPNTINFAYDENADTGGWVNYRGYQNGTGQFRDFLVGNGKQNKIAVFDGSTSFVGIGTDSPGNLLNLEASSGSVAAEVESVSLADTETAIWFAKGKKSGGTSRHAQLGVMYNASGTGASDEACGFVALEQTDGGLLYMWSQNDNDIQVSVTANDVGSTDGVAVGSQSSDERLKNISGDAFPYGLGEVNKLTPIKYAFKSRPDNFKLGFGAQTTQSIIPECVYNSGNCPDGYTQDLYTENDDEVKNGKKQVGDRKGTQTPKSSEKDKLYMKYVEIVPVLVKAIQELSAKVTTLENA